jgi:hypothetical protein
MTMGALGFVLSGTGLVLLWSGIRGENAVQLVQDVFAGRRKVKPPAKPTAPKTSNPGVSVPSTARPPGYYPELYVP